MAAAPGDVLLHGQFDCHMDVSAGTLPLQILRLPWQHDFIEGHFRTSDPDRLVRIAEQDPLEAMAVLALDLQPVIPRDLHWTDDLSAALSSNPNLSLQSWARERVIRPDTLSQSFRRRFGTSPKLFRLEVRARQAWRLVLASNRPLTEIAQSTGFADLAHMTRSIRAFTGYSPSSWRNSACARIGRRRDGIPSV